MESSHIKSHTQKLWEVSFFKSPKCKVLDQPDVKDTLHKLHANYVLVPANKAANNLIIVCKKYCIYKYCKYVNIVNIVNM